MDHSQLPRHAREWLANAQVKPLPNPLRHLPLPLDQILTRATILPTPERLLLSIYLTHDHAIQPLAHLLKLHRSVLSRQLNNIIRRLADPRFHRWAAAALQLAPTDRLIFIQHIFLARSERAIARHTGLGRRLLARKVRWVRAYLHAPIEQNPRRSA